MKLSRIFKEKVLKLYSNFLNSRSPFARKPVLIKPKYQLGHLTLTNLQILTTNITINLWQSVKRINILVCEIT